MTTTKLNKSKTFKLEAGFDTQKIIDWTKQFDLDFTQNYNYTWDVDSEVGDIEDYLENAIRNALQLGFHKIIVIANNSYKKTLDNFEATISYSLK